MFGTLGSGAWSWFMVWLGARVTVRGSGGNTLRIAAMRVSGAKPGVMLWVVSWVCFVVVAKIWPVEGEWRVGQH